MILLAKHGHSSKQKDLNYSFAAGKMYDLRSKVNIFQSNDAHNKLQSHLSKCMQEIYDQEKHIEHLKKAIR